MLSILAYAILFLVNDKEGRGFAFLKHGWM
jgi:hypothetical protein